MCTFATNGTGLVWILEIHNILALSYANGYKVQGGDAEYRKYYMISEAIPDWDANWKYLSGAAFTIPISVVGIFMVSNT